jgi:cyclophilin family peptidyl-prolyl cis-trans isomerase
MASRRNVSDRRRSRPVTKKSTTHKIKRNKPAMALVIIIILMLIFSTFYVVFSSFGNTNGSNNVSTGSYKNDPHYVSALAETEYPVVVIELSEEKAIAIELYNDEMPITCQNFIDLVEREFYNGMIFHRVMDEFMIQAGKSFPDGTTKTSPFGDIVFETSSIQHVDGAISMASRGDQVGGSSEFFICDGPQTGLDGRYAAFGQTIYGMQHVRSIADEPHDSSFGSVGGGKPYNDIIINSIEIINE